MYRDLEGKVAIVTGGSSGIGKAIVKRFYDEGMKVVFTYYSGESNAKELVRSLNEDDVQAIKVNVSKEEDVLNLFKNTIDTFGEVDILVNNAGIQEDVPTHELSIDDFDKVMNINLRGTFIGAREAVKHYLERKVKGSIINISSVHEIIPWPHFAHYSASKGGVKLLTQSMALEYARLGIRINNIAPGSINTPINEEFFSTPEEKEGADDFVPMGYVGEPEQIASIAAFLASNESVYITGQTIVADGGLSLYPSHRNPEHDDLSDEMTEA